ncbi:MAG: DNA-binding transcriptional LysR family regulator, partial [Marinomonas primoryensis]
MNGLFKYMNSVKLAPLLLIFVEVANKRSFTAAAKKLGMSKSAVSQQIKRLEESTGQQLLIRNTRGVVLTAVGETLLARSELLSE